MTDSANNSNSNKPVTTVPVTYAGVVVASDQVGLVKVNMTSSTGQVMYTQYCKSWTDAQTLIKQLNLEWATVPK